MSTSGGESYSHLLVPAWKAYRPAVSAIVQFMDELIQSGIIGKEQEISFSEVVRVEPRVSELPNPFTGKSLKRKTRSRKTQPSKRIAAPDEITALAGPEYDVSATSSSAPRNPPLAVGTRGTDGTWKPFAGPYHLRIVCHVRNTLVRVCRLANQNDFSSAVPEISIPVYDEDCTENETVGFFQHPDLPNVFCIPNAGCARFWIEFEFGKWIWPKLVGDTFGRLNPTTSEAANRIFATDFDEACDWV